MSLRDAAWPSNKQHRLVDMTCLDCGTYVPGTHIGRFYPCGSYPKDFYTPQGVITAGHPEEFGPFVVLDWPDMLTEETAQAALDDFILDRGPEMLEALNSPKASHVTD